jgi:uncharacterized protein (DUF885 family)
MTDHRHSPVPAAVDGAVAWYFVNNPVNAAAMGSTEPEHTRTLGDLSAAGFVHRARTAAQQLAALDALADSPTDFDDEIDRDLLRAQLRGVTILADRQQWRRDPSAYVGAAFNGTYLPLLHAAQPEARLVDDVITKIAEIPAVLAACRANLDPEIAARLFVDRSLAQARTGRAFLTGALPGMVKDEKLRARLADSVEPAARAFDDLAVFLADFAERARGDWRLGEADYSALLLGKEMLGYDTAELHARGRAVYATLDEELGQLAAAIPGGSADWLATMAKLNEDVPPTLEAMLAEYVSETERARRFVKDRDLVTFPDGEDCRVQPGPEFLRAILSVASYDRPPALTPSRIGTFHVPFTPEGATSAEIQARLRTNSRVLMPTISVHEAYPGHHWHFAWLAEQGRIVRCAFTTPYFTEGWGLYIETVMREQGYFTDPRHELGHLDARIFRAARIIVDTALHCGDMTIEEAETFMATKTSLTPPTARSEVNRYCAWPTQAPSYLTGCLAIEDIREEYFARGKGTLKQFHDTIAGSGGLPLDLARRVALR